MRYPEHEKLKALNGANQTVGDFLSWLTEEGYVIAQFDDLTDELFVPYSSIESLLARFFGIDQDRLEAEKQAMLAQLRGENA